MIDSLKTTAVGVTGGLISWFEWLPQPLSVLSGALTCLYLAVKIYNDLYGKEIK